MEAVPRNESWDGCYGWRWFEGGMDAQCDLLVGDAESADRIWYYKRVLHDMLFESTPSPDALEVNYRLCYGKLVDTVPFAI